MINRSFPPLIKTPEKIPDIIPIAGDPNNNITLFHRDNVEMAKVTWLFQEKPPKMAGLAETTNELLTEGCRGYSSWEFKKSLESLGAFADNINSVEWSGLSVTVPRKNLEKAIELCLNALQFPSFELAEIESWEQIHDEQLKVSLEKTSVLAKREMALRWFGENHPMGQLVHPGDIFEIKKNHIIQHYQNVYGNGPCKIIISGNYEPRAVDLVNPWVSFSNIATGPIHELSYPYMPGDYFVSKTDAVQSSVYIALGAPHRKHEDFIATQLATMILGGYFGSRLMKNIREDKGFTYGIHAQLQAWLSQSRIKIQTDMRAEVAQEGLTEIYREIQLMTVLPVTSEELNNARNYLIGAMLRQFENVFSVAERYRHLWSFELPTNYYSTWIHKLNSLNEDDILRVSQKYFSSPQRVSVIAGNIHE